MTSGNDRAERLRPVQHWFLDLDGTTYLGGEPLPGALPLIEHFRRSGTGFTFLTNNSSRSSREYAVKLSRMGFPVTSENVFTSGQATAGYLARTHPEASVYLLGTPAFAAELGAAGISVVEDRPDFVVLGFDPDLDFARLTRACSFLREGSRYLASHPDANCPVAGGYIPDAGSVMALIEASTGRRPEEVVGKPNRRFIEEAAAAAGVDLSRCAMVGDRLETDVEMALTVGIPGVLVLSGATRADDARLGRSPWREEVEVVSGLDGLLESLEVRG
ncbi:MAG TPA: HAD-IIA family hydrolase [Trueperaceae bacterium]